MEIPSIVQQYYNKINLSSFYTKDGNCMAIVDRFYLNIINVSNAFYLLDYIDCVCYIEIDGLTSFNIYL